MMLKKISLIVAIFLGWFALASAQQQSMQDVVYLKNGSIIKGLVLEQVPDKSIKIQTRDGSILVYDMKEVEKIKKEFVSEPQTSTDQASYRQLQKELELNRLQSRKHLDMIGIGGIYALTVLGDFAAGGDVGFGTLIPVVGPFIEIIRIENDPDVRFARSGKELLLLSGIAQSLIAFDYLNTSRKQSKLKRKYSWHFNPSVNNPGLVISIDF